MLNYGRLNETKTTAWIWPLDKAGAEELAKGILRIGHHPRVIPVGEQWKVQVAITPAAKAWARL
jgi:hypothetical protein